jgi:ATP-binding cassette subfamily B protein
LKNLNLSWWRSVCGVVMQDGYLFSDTIARNIAIMDDIVDLKRLKYAAKFTNILQK